MFPPTDISRRNLPHWRRAGMIYWVTFRLADSLPVARLTELYREKECWLARHPEPWTREQRAEHDELFHARVQEWLDAGHGSCALARPEIRALLSECLLRFDGERLRVHAAVIMPNHVHALLEPLPLRSATGIPACAPVARTPPNPQARMPVSPSHTPPPATHALSDLLRGIKGASARAANQLLNRAGAFWMDESYDRIVRDEAEYDHFRNYLRANPTKTRLSADQFWLWPPVLSDTGIPACASGSGASSNPQAEMPVSRPPTE